MRKWRWEETTLMNWDELVQSFFRNEPVLDIERIFARWDGSVQLSATNKE